MRDLSEIQLHEVTITSNPAYLDTSVAKRSMEEWQQGQANDANFRWLDTVDDENEWGPRCVRIY
jgi:phage head maturation protease